MRRKEFSQEVKVEEEEGTTAGEQAQEATQQPETDLIDVSPSFAAVDHEDLIPDAVLTPEEFESMW